MSKIWCINCGQELVGFPIVSSGSPIYCQNDKCKRYGLVTAVYTKDQANENQH